MEAQGRERDPSVGNDRALAKVGTGIAGLDEVLGGGIPRGRTTFVFGGPGCGKTLLGLRFVEAGARDQGEPGVFVAFEEAPEDLVANAETLGMDLQGAVDAGKLLLHGIEVPTHRPAEVGTYDLEGFTSQIEHLIDRVGARRLVIDTLDVLTAQFPRSDVLRAEVHRMIRRLRQRGVTAIVTGEGLGGSPRHDFHAFLGDCVITVDQRVEREIATRRIRVLKYRGSLHDTDEFPFLIGEGGLSVFPLTAVGLDYEVSRERVSSGVPGVDAALGGTGFYRGSVVLVSGTSGVGKSSFASSFADAACRRGERALYVSTEESPPQLVRNMESIGLELGRWREEERLTVASTRASEYGLESHLAGIHALMVRTRPDVVVIDPISGFGSIGTGLQVKSMLTRLLSELRALGVTVLLTNLTSGDTAIDATEVGISSLSDTWILLRDIESGRSRTSWMSVVKSRGMDHAHATLPYAITGTGIQVEAP